jgi:hypothetical protein
MNRLAESCETLGLTPEMLFRITDRKRSKSVIIEDFRETLNRIKLGLDAGVVTRVCSMVTQTGLLSHLDYHQCLAAFKVDAEPPPWGEAQTFFQLSLA